MQTLTCEKILVVETTKNGLPAMWECGGSEGNTGCAQMIGGKYAEELTPTFIRDRDDLACQHHVLLILGLGYLVVNINRNDDKYIGTISKVVSNKEHGYHLSVISYLNQGTWDVPLDVLQTEYGYTHIHSLVNAAMRKTKLYHCRYSIYSKWWKKDSWLGGRKPTTSLLEQYVREQVEEEWNDQGLFSLPLQWFDEESSCLRQHDVRKYITSHRCGAQDVLHIIEQHYYEGEFDRELLRSYFVNWQEANYRPSQFIFKNKWLYQMKKDRFSKTIGWCSWIRDSVLPDITVEDHYDLDLFGQFDINTTYWFENKEQVTEWFYGYTQLDNYKNQTLIGVALEHDIPELQDLKKMGVTLYSLEEYKQVVNDWLDSYLDNVKI